MPNRILLVSMLLLSAAFAHAQKNLKFEHLTIEDGLSQGTVESIIQDSRGFIWFATRDGLNRYDGRDFKVFKHVRDDTSSLSNNFTRRIIEDSDGFLWVCTKNGLNRFDPDTERFQRYYNLPGNGNSLSSNNVLRVCQDKSGLLWIGTWGGGLNSLDVSTRRFKRYHVELADSVFERGNIINSIYEDRKGTIWVGAITGLFSSTDQMEFKHHAISDARFNGVRDNIVICIVEDESGALWLGTYSGLLKYEPQTGQVSRFSLDPADPKNLNRNQVRFLSAVGVKGDQQLWLGTNNSGLAIFDKTSKSFDFVTHKSSDAGSIGHNSLWCAYEDRSGTIWLGTDGKGIEKLSPMSARFPHISAEPNNKKKLSESSIWSFTEDRDGNLWVGTNTGVEVLRAGSQNWQRPARSNLPSEAIYAMLQDRRGHLWFAGATSGLYRIQSFTAAEIEGDRLQVRNYRHDSANPASLSADRLFSLYEDRAGSIWVGTVDEGVALLDPRKEEFTHFKPNQNDTNSIRGTGVECIYQDHEGRFWFGTSANGLNRLDYATKNFTYYSHNPAVANSLSNNHVNSILQDKNDILWIATGEGLNCLNSQEGTFKHYFESAGLPNSYIYGLLQADDGAIWLSTNSGLARFDPMAETFRNFSIKDGLQSKEFNAGAYYRSPRGELFFGGHNGFNRFFPRSVQRNPHVPPVVLTAFTTLNKPAELDRAIYSTQTVSLSHRDYFFSFEFAALDYWAPERNQYRYRMEGLDLDWIDAGTRNFVTYTNLDAGDYVFRVSGSNSDQIWNEDGAALKIKILPPFWQTWWFYILVSILVLGMIYSLYSYRVNRLLDMERLRTRISSDLHDELATNLSTIAMFSRIVQESSSGKDTTKDRSLLTRIQELSQESVSSIRDIIWAISSRPETLNSLLTRLQDFVKVACKARNIQLNFDIPEASTLPQKNLSPETRQHLWLLLKESVNNILKHADCTKLQISFSYQHRLLKIIIQDDGKGFDPMARHDGNGLQTMKMRTQELGGRLSINSELGSGTHIKIQVPA